MEFHDVRFPARLSFGSMGGPERKTEIVTLANGYEERNTPWSQSRRRYDAGVGLRSLDDVAEVVDFFEARRGRLSHSAGRIGPISNPACHRATCISRIRSSAMATARVPSFN